MFDVLARLMCDFDLRTCLMYEFYCNSGQVWSYLLVSGQLSLPLCPPLIHPASDISSAFHAPASLLAGSSAPTWHLIVDAHTEGAYALV